MMTQNHIYTHNHKGLADIQVVSLFTEVVKDFFQIDLKKHAHFDSDFTFYMNQLNQRVTKWS